MSRLDAPGRRTGIDTARRAAIWGMLATHIFPLLIADDTGAGWPSWAYRSLTGVSSALFVVLAGVGLTLLTKNSSNLLASRLQLSLRAVSLIVVGLFLGHAGSNVAIILVHYGVLFLLAMWFIGLSRKALTLPAIIWLLFALLLPGVLTLFMLL